MFVAKNKFVAANWSSNPRNNIKFAKTSVIVSKWLRISFHFFFLFLRKNCDFLKTTSFFILLERIFARWNESYFVRPNVISWGGFFFFVEKNFISLERIFVCWNECYFVTPNVISWGGFFLFVGTNSNSCPLKQMF